MKQKTQSHGQQSLRSDYRAQAYLLEAIVAVLLILTVVLFIAPSITTTPGDDRITQLQEEKEVSDDVITMLDQHSENGQLKSLMLNYDVDDRWTTEYPGDGDYRYGPDESPFAAPASGDDSYYLIAPGPVGSSIEDIEETHDVSISVYLIPESELGNDNPERVEFIRATTQSEGILTTETTEVTLYDDDRLQSEPGTHSRRTATTPQTEGSGDRLSESGSYPIESVNDGSESVVYNTVTVQVVVYDDTQEDEN